jgi:FkbM family methyltransferase
MSIPRQLAPGLLTSFWDWTRRFQHLGFPLGKAMRAAMNVRLRNAVLGSRIEQIPAAVRTKLHVVIDVGSHEGNWLAALRQLTPIAHAEVFEPNPACFRHLTAAYGTDTTVRLHHLGVANQPGELQLKVSASSDFSSFLNMREHVARLYSPEAARVVESITVPVDTLDRALAHLAAIDLLKIDVQGLERQVLAGATAVLKRTRAVLIEMLLTSHYHGDDTLGGLDHLLTQQYGLVFHDMSAPFRSSSGQAMWLDACYVNPALL